MSPTPARVAGTVGKRYFLMAAGGVATVPGCSLRALSPDTTTNSELRSAIEAVNSTVKSSIENSINTVTNDLWPYVVMGIIVVVILAGVLVLVLFGAFWLLRRAIERFSYLNQKPVWQEREKVKQLHEAASPLSDRTPPHPREPGSRAGT